MKDSYVTAKLVEPNLIRLVIFSSLPFNRPEPYLVVDKKLQNKLTPTRVSTLSSLAIADFRLSSSLELGHSYFLALNGYGMLPLDVSEATSFPGFDTRYYYGEDDLGATYSKKKTRFVVWAPLASQVILLLRKGQEEYRRIVMNRGSRGEYSIEVAGDLEGYRYLYEVINNEVINLVTDPYAKGSTLNGEESVVLDYKKLRIDLHKNTLPVLNSPCEAILYEAHVRDMTIDSHTNIVHKGTFKGMVEKNRKTEGGNKAGFDYLKSLGFTHLQLLPIYDFKSVNEENPDEKYNWGYDPQQYFVPEGSYASNREDPYSRIRDLKEMVAEFHKEGIRIVMDVVYNHVYEYEHSVFERVVPNYYFRKRNNGMMANTSGCGNDLASERPMVKKLILDACEFWIDEYGIDGFRFDLMGIMTVDVLLEIEKMAKAKDKSFLLYGEGWNMGGDLSAPLGQMGNCSMLPNYAFFNDHYRESAKKYFVGDMNALPGFKHALISSSLHFLMPAKFINANQTINYVECHDNGTFYDYLEHCHPEEGVNDRLELCSLALDAILASFGIPFIHMGQEIGQSKWGEDNTYNKGDHYNKFSYSLLDKRIAMVERLKKSIEFRKNNALLRVYDPRVIEVSVDLIDLGNALRVKCTNPNGFFGAERFEYVINPSPFDYSIEENGVKSLVPPRSFVVIKE